MNKRIEQVQDAAQTAQNIRESMEKIPHLKEKGLLDAVGIELSSESSESDTDSELTDEPDKANRPDSDGLKSENDNAIVVSTDNQIDTSCNKLQTKPLLLLAILRYSDFNWLEFINVARENATDLSDSSFEEQVSNFYQKLPLPGMSDSEMNAVQQSREVYTLRKYEEDRQHEIGNVVSESDESNSEEDTSTIESAFEARAKVLIKKRRESLRRKATRNAKRKIAEERLLKRSRSRKVSKVLQSAQA